MFKSLSLMLLIVACLFSSTLLAENWNLELIQEVDYSEENALELIHSSSLSSLNDTIITYFFNNQQFLFNTISYETIAFGEEGSGPGEFRKASNLIEFKDRKYCIDNRKYSLIFFDKDNNLINDIRVDHSSMNLINIDDKYIVAKKNPTHSGSKLLNFYDSDGKLIKKECPVIDEVLNYKTYPKLTYLYMNSQLIYHKKDIYLLFNWLPCLLKYSQETMENEIIDFEDQLPFKPSRPVLDIGERSGLVASVYYQSIVGQNENSIFVHGRNRGSLKASEITYPYFFKIDPHDKSVSMIDLYTSNEKINLTEYHDLYVLKNRLYLFDEEAETLKIYRIK